ncbi:MAG TPA: ATP-binding protein [Blastocatellia bacterium]|nr:ATP-binding protein [Blastocatellia bacterium]
MHSALDHRNADAWPLLIDAAVVGSFLPRELAPEAVEEDKRPEAEKTVLSFAEITYSPDGVKWSLKQETRTEVLQATLQTDDLQKAIHRTASQFFDDFSHAIRDCLTESPDEMMTVDLKSLEATRVAVAALSGISGMKLPALDDLDREIEFRRLMAQFKRMVGQRPEDSGPENTHYFFGRDQELERLRDYVGVIAATSIGSTAKRALNWFSRAIQGRLPMTVWGVGGVGKTTLISQFMLEHAEAAASRFPFAYLDFDRATISARQRFGLLAEMCLQTGSQFKELAQPMADLRSRVREFAQKLEETGELEYLSFLTPYLLNFRDLIDKHFESVESTFERARPFLLVFDTFEVVQYTQDDVAGLEEFAQGFSRPNESGMWKRLRLIISGRKKVSIFSGPVEELQLGALDPKGSAELLLALARDAGKPIKPSSAIKLVAAIAKITGESNKGVQPLRLRLIGEVFRKMTEEGPIIVRSLIQELKHPLKADGIAAQALIDGILIRRVLGHVTDPRVKALADPGLVVRRITRDVIKEVMTRGTSDPAVSETEDADADPFTPWIVDEAEAQSIFEAFSKEVSLVEPDGDALRHRPDVRQQMLPLIQARRHKRFEALNQLAFDYFCARARQDEKDWASASEAIYHGLWLNEPLSDLNKLWQNSPAFDPRIDPEEFDKSSLANIFVRAKVRAPLASNEVSTLPREVALAWLDARSTDLLRDRRIEDAIQAIHTVAGDHYEALDECIGTVAVLARLLYRAGVWDDAVQLILRHLNKASNEELIGPDKKEGRNREERANSRGAALLSLTRTWATIAGKSDGPRQALERISEVVSSVRDPLIRVEIAAYALFAIKQLGSEWQGQNERLTSVIETSIPDVSPDQWRREQRVLRLAILICSVQTTELMQIWFESRERVPRDIEVSAISDLLLQIFRGEPVMTEVEKIIDELQSRQKSEALIELDALWRREKSVVLEALQINDDKAGFKMLVAGDHSDWARPMGNALARALRQENGEALTALLDKGGYWNGGKGHWRQQDGVAVVQSAADEGRLLELAAALVRWKETFLNKEGAVEQQSAYPQGVFDISRALLRWHSIIIASFEASGSTATSS